MKEKICFVRTTNKDGIDLLNQLAQRLTNDKIEFTVEHESNGFALFKNELIYDEMSDFYDRERDRAYDLWKDK